MGQLELKQHLSAVHGETRQFETEEMIERFNNKVGNWFRRAKESGLPGVRAWPRGGFRGNHYVSGASNFWY